MNNYITVGQLNNYLKRKFEADQHLEHVYLKGEISNCKLHSRGHLYFSLKDETSVIGAIMFAGNVSTLKFEPKEGTKVFAEGKVTVYEASGKYQIVVTKMEPDGIGALYIAYEKLKKDLEKENIEIIEITRESITNMKNIKFEEIIILKDIELQTEEYKYMKEIISKVQYLIINEDIEMNVLADQVVGFLKCLQLITG